MTAPAAQCPSCGAPFEFRWAGAVQSVCPYCSSVIVRHDVALERVGVVSAPPSADSRIQLGTRGEYGGRSFEVVGRIAYAWERGAWNEWHVVTGGGASAWLAEADGELSMTVLAAPAVLPAPESVRLGDVVEESGGPLQVTEVVRARYAGTEGDLPFAYWDKDEILFADLRSHDGRVGTIDYSESPPLLFAGEAVSWDALKLAGLRDLEAPKAQEVRTLRCPQCGGAVTVRAAGRTVSVVCGSCGSVLDAQDPGLRVLQIFQQKLTHSPRIPLGTRGRLHGAEWEVIGFQIRSVTEEAVQYPWSEYVLFHPERGFRYLTEENGHWTDATPLHNIPKMGTAGGRPIATLNGETFKHFATDTAATTFVLGEFPWEVHVGDEELVRDFVHPPRMLSWEDTAGESTWTLAEYVPPATIWKNFGLPGLPPAPRGVFACQPSPHTDRSRRYRRAFMILMALFTVLTVGRCATARNDRVFSERYAFRPGLPEDSNSIEAGPIVLTGRPAALQVEVDTDLDNAWAFFSFALVNEETGKRLEFGREVSQYHGVEGGESWSEGSSSDEVRLPSVPAGRYQLLIDPEAEVPVGYTVTLTHDVPGTGFFFAAFLLLAAPAALAAFASIGFESQRWQESDYAPEEDDDD
ncbi:MAG TPA: DUF4178 domain-containing protein [Longimicrobium sp.]